MNISEYIYISQKYRNFYLDEIPSHLINDRNFMICRYNDRTCNAIDECIIKNDFISEYHYFKNDKYFLNDLLKKTQNEILVETIFKSNKNNLEILIYLLYNHPKMYTFLRYEEDSSFINKISQTLNRDLSNDIFFAETICKYNKKFFEKDFSLKKHLHSRLVLNQYLKKYTNKYYSIQNYLFWATDYLFENISKKEKNTVKYILKKNLKHNSTINCYFEFLEPELLSLLIKYYDESYQNLYKNKYVIPILKTPDVVFCLIKLFLIYETSYINISPYIISNKNYTKILSEKIHFKSIFKFKDVKNIIYDYKLFLLIIKITNFYSNASGTYLISKYYDLYKKITKKMIYFNKDFILYANKEMIGYNNNSLECYIKDNDNNKVNKFKFRYKY